MTNLDLHFEIPKGRLNRSGLFLGSARTVYATAKSGLSVPRKRQSHRETEA